MNIFLSILLIFFPQEILASIASSVWCHGSHMDHRHCTFHNLCYSPFHKQYLFFHSRNESIMSGIDEPAEQIQLVRLTSVMGKEDLYLNYVPMPKEVSDQYDIEFVDRPILIVKRWRPLDPFSMIHDDLMPIYFTLKYICTTDSINECLKDYIIAFNDETKSKNQNLYEELFPNVMYLSRYSNYFGQHQLLCFRHSTVGLESESLWYNYGFDSLSNNVGAINNVNFRPHLVEHFRKFVLEKLELPTDTGTKMHDVAVMFESDKFQNIHEIKTILQHHFKLKVTLVNPKMVSTKELIWIMSKSQMLIAFAQSFNVFSLFLPKISTGVLELFPFGLDESSLPQTATLIQKRGLLYHSWINSDPDMSKTGPNGLNILSHLDLKTAQAIKDQDHVQAMPCCNDPALEYKLDQVTIVNPISFKSAFEMFLDDLKNDANNDDNFESKDEWIIPGPILNGKCSVSADQGPLKIQFEWKPPLNLNFIPHDKITYEILVQAVPYDKSEGYDSLGQFSTSEQKLFVTSTQENINLKKHEKIQSYVVSVLDFDLRSGETVISCVLDQF